MNHSIVDVQKSDDELVRGVPRGLEFGLRNFWYPLLQSAELPAGTPVAIKCLGEDLVAFRDAEGRPQVLHDRCPHRYVKLSAGRIFGDELQCIYHGLRFDGRGMCTLVPWEDAGTKTLPRDLRARAYKARDVGGIVWAYIGDETRFPAPPLEDSLPEELLHPDKFVHFVLPTEIWEANWLLVIDGSDSYHAVTLHAESQGHDAVLKYLDQDVVATMRPQTGQASDANSVPLQDRRVRIVETDGHGLRGISVDRDGNHLEHGHKLRPLNGERFNLPGLISKALKPVSHAPAYVSRLFQVPIDYDRTRLFRYAAWRAESEEERQHFKDHFERVVKPRQLKTSAEDRMIAGVSGDLIESRSNEMLLSPDRDMLRIRRRLSAAYRAQAHDALRRPEAETTSSRDTLVFPV